MITKSSRFILVFISTILGLMWVMLISLPQDGNSNLALLTGIYFFPFFFLLVYLVTFFLQIESLKRFENTFQSAGLFIVTTIVLVIITILSFLFCAENFTLLSFFTNIFSFFFCLFTYYRLKGVFFKTEVRQG